MAKLNTRIRLRYDSYENWYDNNPELLSGELAVVYIKEGNTQEVNSVNAPQVLFKVGPGYFNSLPWTSGKAADVYSWAKQGSLYVSTSGSGNVVSSIEWDATLNNGKGGLKYTTTSVATSGELSTLQGVVNTLNGNLATLTGRVDAHDGLLSGLRTDVDSKVAQSVYGSKVEELENKITANTDLINDEVTNRGTAISNAITQEVSDRNTAIETAVNAEKELRVEADNALSNRIADYETNKSTFATVSQIATEVDDRNKAIQDAIDQEVNDRNSAIQSSVSSAINQEVLDRNSAIEEAIAGEVVDRNSAIETAVSTEREARLAAAEEEQGRVNNLFDDIYNNRLSDIDTTLQNIDERIDLIDEEGGRLSLIETNITTLVGEDINKSVRTIANEELVKQLIPSDAQDSLNTLEEIAAWIQDHPESASAMNEQIQKNKTAIEVLNGADTVDGSVAKAVKVEADRAKGVESGHETRIGTLEGYFTGSKANDADKLDGQDGSYYAKASDVEGHGTRIGTLEGYFDNSGKANSAASADNASKLGNQLPSYYAKDSDVTTLKGYFTSGKANTAVTSEDSAKLGGQLPSHYATASDVEGHGTRIGTLEGYFDGTKANVAKKADDADKLGGQLPTYYADKQTVTNQGTAINTLQGYFTSGVANNAADSAKLGGQLPSYYATAADKEELSGKISAEETRATRVEEGLDGRIKAIEEDTTIVKTTMTDLVIFCGDSSNSYSE